MITKAEILAASDPAKVFGADTKAGWRALAKTWHPDHNHDPDAPLVMAKLQALHERAEGKVVFEKVKVACGSLEFRGISTVVLTTTEKDGIETAQNMTGMATASPPLRKRIPTADATPSSVTMQFPTHIVSLSSVLLRNPAGIPSKHVAWMVSRLYEQVMLTTFDVGMTHCGLVPESLVIEPESHGVFSVDWRFSVPKGATIKRVPAGLIDRVPADKKASSVFDMYAVNRIANILLGDPSGIGNVLRLKARSDPKALPEKFLAWFQTSPNPDPEVHYNAYRALLKECWGAPKYHKFDI